MKKRFIALLLTVFMTLTVFAGCSVPGNDPTPPTSDGAADSGAAASGTADTPKEWRVAVALSGPVNDGGWNTGAYNGLEAIKAKYGVETSYSESVDASSFEEIFRNYVTLGYNVIFGHGSEFGEAASIVAADYPDVIFCVNSTTNFTEPNLAGVNPDGNEMGIILGVAAGYATKTKKIGAIGGANVPTNTDPMNGFAAGAKSVDPEITCVMSIIDSFEDAALAKEQALAMIDAGVDVIFCDCDIAGMGIFEACKERNVYCMPTYGDQNYLVPDHSIMSGLCDAGLAMVAVMDEIVNGTFKAQSYVFGVQAGCTGYVANDAVYNKAVSAEGQAAVEDIYNKIKSGEAEAYALIEQYLPAAERIG